MNSRQYVAGFNFKGSDQQKKVGKLSGGERNRAAPGQAAAHRRQPAAARRADQRPRRRHAARARGGAAELRRLRGGHLPRSLVPRPRSPRTCWRSRATRRSTWFEGNFEAYEEHRRASASAPRPTARTASRTSGSRARSRKFGPPRTFRWHDSRCRAARMQPRPALRRPPRPTPAPVMAGAAKVDGTYNVGSSAGQYARQARRRRTATYDPHVQQVKNKASYGVQSRESVRALVIKGADGKYVAMVSDDHYIPQDALFRRTAQLASAATGGALNETNITMSITHNHSSPSYSSLDAGVWTFQDVFDFRFYDYYAKQNASRRRQGVRATCTTSASARRSATSTRPSATRWAPAAPTTARRPASPTPTPTTTCRSSASRTSTTPAHPSRWRRWSTSASTPSSSRATT